MSDPINTPPTESYVQPAPAAKAVEGEPQAIPWVRRPSPASAMECCICKTLKPWHLFDRKTGKGLCSACYTAGNRLGEKEG